MKLQEPIIVLPLSQYEEIKEKERIVKEFETHAVDAIMTAAMPRLMGIPNHYPLDYNKVREIARDIADDALKRLNLE